MEIRKLIDQPVDPGQEQEQEQEQHPTGSVGTWTAQRTNSARAAPSLPSPHAAAAAAVVEKEGKKEDDEEEKEQQEESPWPITRDMEGRGAREKKAIVTPSAAAADQRGDEASMDNSHKPEVPEGEGVLTSTHVGSGPGPSGSDDAVGTAAAAAAAASTAGPSSHGAAASSAQVEFDAASLSTPSTFSVGLSIDTDSSDADSALGSFRAQSSSMSASSSVFDFVEEHGRTWHRYHEGKYMLPNDIPEQERLDLQHSISVRLFGGLYLAPIDRPHRVLDIGTGTGIWAIEFANEHPESDVLGTDLSPIQPEYVPPNCRFEVDDAEDDWVFSHRFDYIHARYMTGAFQVSKFPDIFRMCYENTTPGGWIEFQDYYAKFQCVDDSLAGTALERWNNCLLEGVRRIGKSGVSCAKYKSQMIDAGFVDVVEKKFALPGNPWAKGDDQKMLGSMQMENILDGIHGMSIGLFTKVLGMAAEEVELMLVDVRKDLRNTRIHFYYIVYAVYGRKPI